MMNFTLLTLSLLLPLCAVRADEAPLDPPYKNMVHPRVSAPRAHLEALLDQPKVDVEAVIAEQSPVKAQQSRGTCSIFSATALLESLLIHANQDRSINLSEEWLQYLIAQESAEEGSSSYRNFDALIQYGQPSEETMPYIGEHWTDATFGEALQRCSGLEDFTQRRCLVGHRNPELLTTPIENLLESGTPLYDPEMHAARVEAEANKAKFFGPEAAGNGVYDTAQVKALLDAGIPLTLDISFFYGAWSHRLAPELGIERDLQRWSNGVVIYPELNSLDRINSDKKPAGHSVVVVGYDDSVELKYNLKMKTGRTKTFTRKGVYYFKNSWGTQGFGSNFLLRGNSYPGYGMISQDYANDLGSFHQLKLN